MPTFTFENLETGEVWNESMKNSEREEFLAANPQVRQLLTNLSIGYRVGGIKTDAGWRDVLRKIKKANPRSTIDPGNISQI